MMYARTLFSTLVLTATLCAGGLAQELRPFTPELALDVRNVRIADVTDDGSRVAATVQTRRDRTDVDHQRFGDPTYISPASTRLLIIDTRSGDQTWVHEEPARLRGFTWSPDGTRLAYFMFVDDRYSLRIHDADSGATYAVDVRAEEQIASGSPLVWSPDGEAILLTLRPLGWAAEARDAFLALTERLLGVGPREKHRRPADHGARVTRRRLGP
jgi:hypothetical protein